ncbi:MAG: PPC domain-containing protein, partial [Opitutales bacterium]|nr:PPC domain-containing protein [Opitutales bacterium]
MNFLKKTLVFFAIFAAGFAFAKPPSVMFVYPAGGKVGTSFKATIGALDADFASGISISGEGVSAKILGIEEMPPERAEAAAKRNEAKGMKFVIAEIKIAKNAEIGVRDLRLTSTEGASTRYFFEVENLSETLEAADHQSIKTAQKIEKLPAVVNGQVYEGERDFYEFKLEKGKTYVFDLHARKIRPYLADAVPGWFQATMRLYGQDGKSAEYADDFQNSPDPVLIYTPEVSGKYFLEVKDALYRGRDDFVYRLRCGELPYIKSIFPCGGNSAAATEVELDGANLPAKKLKVKKEPGDQAIKDVCVSKNGTVSNSVKFDFDDFPEFSVEPNSEKFYEPEQIPCVLNGSFKNPYDKFKILIRAKKGDNLTFEVLSSRLGYPVDARLKLVNLKSQKIVAQNDDFEDASFGLVTAQFDPRIIYNFKNGGDFLLVMDEAQN